MTNEQLKALGIDAKWLEPLNKTFEKIFGKESNPRYKLVRESDGLTKTSLAIKWLEFDEEGRYKADFQEIAIGRSLIMSPFNIYFTWQTTPVTEIVEQREDYIKLYAKR